MKALLNFKREAGVVINVIQGAIIGLFLTALSYFIGIHADWITEISVLEAFAVFTSYVCTYLCVFQRRINYPIGAISTAAYCWLFYRFDLNASMAINAFLSVYLLYGWIRWRSDDDTRPVTRMSLRDWLISAAIVIPSYGVIAALTSAFDGKLVWTDSVIFAGTVLAQFLLDNKKLENWLVWIGVNVFAIYTYFANDLTLVGFQYIFFLANAFYAYTVWRKSHREQQAQEEYQALIDSGLSHSEAAGTAWA